MKYFLVSFPLTWILVNKSIKSYVEIIKMQRNEKKDAPYHLFINKLFILKDRYIMIQHALNFKMSFKDFVSCATRILNDKQNDKQNSVESGRVCLSSAFFVSSLAPKPCSRYG